MNRVIFKTRLKECRKHYFKTQQEFADAYIARYGMIRDSQRKDSDSNMFGTVQAWEQGKSTPTAEVLANICDLLQCDADYLLGRIEEHNHVVSDFRQYTGLSAEAIEKLHAYSEQLKREEWWLDDVEEQHDYFKGYAVFLIDEILTGSKHHELDASQFNKVYEFVYEDFVDGEKLDIDDYRFINSIIDPITHSISSIITENAENRVFPPALAIRIRDNCYQFRLSSNKTEEEGIWPDV